MGLLKKMNKLKKANYFEISKQDVVKLKGGKRIPKIKGHADGKKEELKAFKQEVSAEKKDKQIIQLKGSGEFLPTRVSSFDDLIEAKGLERGSTILISGGAGTGKTTFCLQSIYNGVLKGEKGIYITLEEEPEKLKKHMLRNFGWDFQKLEDEGKAAIVKYDALEISRNVEAALASTTEKLAIEFEEFSLPFKPDRLAVDSLTSLSAAFGSTESYRRYIRYLFEKLEDYNSINFVISETEQNPKEYSRAGIEEFLADGVIVLYSIQEQNNRENAIEILKLRTSKHEKRIVPYEITNEGMTIYPNAQIFRPTAGTAPPF